MREVITIEFKGPTRSGKSTGGIAICFFIAKLTGVPFTFWNICSNEIEYLQKVKDPDLLDGSTFLIDEQTETHTGVGSYAEMMVLEDLSAIIAKKQINTVWVHPSEFVGRGGQIGIETWGKEIEHKMIRGIMYNLGQGALRSMPMGIVMIPIAGLYPCHWFGKKTVVNGRETIVSCGSSTRPICPNYKKCKLFMRNYEAKKDEQVEAIRTQDFSKREMARLEVADRVSKHPLFLKAKKKNEKIAVARMLVPYGTPEKAIAEIVDIATSTNISVSELKKAK